MNETPLPPDPPSQPEPDTAPPPPPPRRLTKSADSKIGGVAAGIAEYFGIDPTIVRLLFVASIFLGGFGLIAYLIAWAVLPADDGANGPAAPHTLASTGSTVVAVGLLVAGAIVAAATIDHPFGGGLLVPLGLVGAGAFLLVQQPDGSRRSSPSPQSPDGSSAEPPGEANAASPGRAASPGTGLALRSRSDVVAGPGPGDDPTAPLSSRAAPPDPPVVPPAPPEPVPPIGSLVLSALAILGATAFLIDAAGWAEVSAVVVFAIALGVVGLGLLAAARWGGGRGLVPLGLLLTLVLLVSSVVDPAFSDGVGERDYRPDAIDELRSEYRHGIGQLELDLTALELPEGEHAVEIHMGIGEVQVIVPDDISVDVDGSLDMGELRLFDQTQNGIRNDLEVVEEVDEAPLLVLDIDSGIGHVEVRRESEVGR